MTCREVDEALMRAGPDAELPEAVRRHVETCADCRRMVASMAGHGEAVQPREEVLQRIRGPILQGLTPVRPLAPSLVYAGLFAMLVLVVAVAVAAVLRFHGLLALGQMQRVVIGVALIVTTMAAAAGLAQLMVPGGWRVGPGAVFGASVLLVESTFLALFHDYGAGRFVHDGAACLIAGLICASAAGGFAWLLMRRGLIVDYVGVGLTLGTLAGLTGVAMLELHCANLLLPHVAVWHGAVLLVSGGAGALAGTMARRFRRLL